LAVLAPFLPALQVYRILRITTGWRRLRGRVLLALPAIVDPMVQWVKVETVERATQVGAVHGSEGGKVFPVINQPH